MIGDDTRKRMLPRPWQDKTKGSSMFGAVMMGCVSGLAMAMVLAVAGAPFAVCFAAYSLGGAGTLLAIAALGNPLRPR